MGNVRIYSQLDQEAQKALQDYRLSIGLPPVAEFERPKRIVEIGGWVDCLRLWVLFVTATFRPIGRRWKNAAGFRALETVIRKGSEMHSTLSSSDFTEESVSCTPSAAYVQGFFSRWVEGLTQKLLQRVDYFVGFEAGTQTGANHFHALVAAEGLRDYSRKELWQDLFDSAGRSLVLPFDPGRGAGWYLAAAYVGKKQLGWDVSVGNRALIAPRPCSRWGPGSGSFSFDAKSTFSFHVREMAPMKRQEIRIFVDGSGTDPNGVAGFAWLCEGQKPHVEWGQGWTNNEAEYRAVLSAVQTLPRGTEATVLCDSALVIRQLRGEYEVHEPRLYDLHSEIQTLIADNDLQLVWIWIPRKENKADRLLRQKPKGADQSLCAQKQMNRAKSQAKAH